MALKMAMGYFCFKVGRSMRVNGKMAHSTVRVFRQILKVSQEKEFGKMEKEQVGLVVLYKIHQNESQN